MNKDELIDMLDQLESLDDLTDRLFWQTDHPAPKVRILCSHCGFMKLWQLNWGEVAHELELHPEGLRAAIMVSSCPKCPENQGQEDEEDDD